MDLNPRQADALQELINIAFGRTASALSVLTGHRVLLDAPHAAVLAFEELAPTLGRYVPGYVASIHQEFSGPIAGDALLILSEAGAVALTGLLTDTARPLERLDESAREVLTEVGNILLNACLSSLGNLLHVRVNFSVPQMRLNTVADLVSSLPRVAELKRHAIVVSMAFRVRDSTVEGYLAMVLGVASLAQLITELEAWESRGERSR